MKYLVPNNVTLKDDDEIYIGILLNDVERKDYIVSLFRLWVSGNASKYDSNYDSLFIHIVRIYTYPQFQIASDHPIPQPVPHLLLHSSCC